MWCQTLFLHIYKISCTLSKQLWPCSDSAFCCVWSGSIPFANIRKIPLDRSNLNFRGVSFVFIWCKKNVREKSRECHSHKMQPFPNIKRRRKPTNPNKHKSINRTKSTKISSLFPKRGNRNAKKLKKKKKNNNTRTKWHKVRHKKNRLVE